MEELLSRLSSKALTRWMAYETVEPWGEARMDLRFGQLLALVANLFKGEKDAPSRPADWVPDFAKHPEEEA